MSVTHFYNLYCGITDNTSSQITLGHTPSILFDAQIQADLSDKMRLFLHSSQLYLSQNSTLESYFPVTPYINEDLPQESTIDLPLQPSTPNLIPETDDPETGHMYIDDRFFKNQAKERLCCTDHVSEFLENDNMILRSGNNVPILPFKDTCFYPTSLEYWEDNKFSIIPFDYSDSVPSLSSCSEEKTFFDEDFTDQLSQSNFSNVTENLECCKAESPSACLQPCANAEMSKVNDSIPLDPEPVIKEESKSPSIHSSLPPQEKLPTADIKPKSFKNTFKNENFFLRPTVKKTPTCAVKDNFRDSVASVKRTATSYDSETTKYLKSVFYNIYSKTNKLSKTQRRDLQENTGLSPRSITYWFSNHKRRHPKDIQAFKKTIADSKGKLKTYEDFLHVQLQSTKKTVL
ncbi:Homeodomain-like DNA binding domain-containing transcription factor [Phycomyces blakesleeanus]|uniref:Homeodomain-like DNA binding domain-containing transcription factor n=2 Tax=Phycomyces blakesleeanus TaxID=4837 RepID=A0A167PLD2_PHYB8|nr:Homeodomain-like DNA binding domain-containing transcription factor [Phycomyces blakesleeanus NRRL 1555(-)]OAD78166.1 Homeodomain-like DNA binding domain-containing transcription factor [Phycomyces blakesleeanus NRRL 1555(-)]|eukprot:XP_018296206.1 Homeodomain-like DNA binding domain-containing transcription factor [Phycomyces blakesleeanus NRRL 1555(-)]